MDTYLVAYDICDPKRLRKVARACEDFGLRRQYFGLFVPDYGPGPCAIAVEAV
jgi:hypothetical protein